MATIARVVEVDDRTGTPLAELPQEDKDLRFLHAYSDDFLACRGDHHVWPQIKPSKKARAIRGMRAYAQTDGTYLLEQDCLSCGRVRWRITGQGGYYSNDNGWHYRQPKGYSAPRGSKLTRADFTAELYRRFAESNLAIQAVQ